MFNVGIIASRKTQAAVKITGMQIPVYSGGSFINFGTDGKLYFQNSTGSLVQVPGEWYSQPTPDINMYYQRRVEIEVGSNGFWSNNTWTAIAGNVGWNSGLTGRFRVHIREISTGITVASAQFWNSPTYAP